MLSRTFWFSASLKYPNDVNRLRTRPNAPRRRNFRMSSFTHSTRTPSRSARLDAMRSMVSEISTPVTL